MKRLTFLALILSGCAGDEPVPYSDSQLARAQDLAWADILSNSGYADHRVGPPAVEWVRLPMGESCLPGSEDACYGGWFNRGTWSAIVAVRTGHRLSDWVVLAHELCHGRAYFEGGDGDPLHVGPCYVPGGWAEHAQAALAAAGF